MGLLSGDNYLVLGFISFILFEMIAIYMVCTVNKIDDEDIREIVKIEIRKYIYIVNIGYIMYTLYEYFVENASLSNISIFYQLATFILSTIILLIQYHKRIFNNLLEDLFSFQALGRLYTIPKYLLPFICILTPYCCACSAVAAMAGLNQVHNAENVHGFIILPLFFLMMLFYILAVLFVATVLYYLTLIVLTFLWFFVKIIIEIFRLTCCSSNRTLDRPNLNQISQTQEQSDDDYIKYNDDIVNEENSNDNNNINNKYEYEEYQQDDDNDNDNDDNLGNIVYEKVEINVEMNEKNIIKKQPEIIKENNPEYNPAPNPVINRHKLPAPNEPKVPIINRPPLPVPSNIQIQVAPIEVINQPPIVMQHPITFVNNQPYLMGNPILSGNQIQVQNPMIIPVQPQIVYGFP